MPINLKNLFTSPGPSSSVMLICGLLSLLASLAVAALVWTHWNDLGVILGARSRPLVIVLSGLGLLLAAASGIWALLSVDKLKGSSAFKCTVAYLLDAVALAVLAAFIIITYFLRVS